MKLAEQPTLKKPTLTEQCSDEVAKSVSIGDPLVLCLSHLCAHYGRSRSETVLLQGLPLTDGNIGIEMFLRAAKRQGLTGKVIKRPLEDIPEEVLPVILILKDETPCVLIKTESGDQLCVMDPKNEGKITHISRNEVSELYSGFAIFIQPDQNFATGKNGSSVKVTADWFWSAIRNSRWSYIQVGIASVFINLFVLASPVFVMNVYDRVIPNNAIETGWVLAIGITIVYLFDFILRMLRTVFIDFAGKKADIILACRIFDQLLDLKISARPKSAGGMANTLREFETVRDFFTSATLASFVDLPFVFLFILIIWVINPALGVAVSIIALLAVIVGLLLQAPLRNAVEKYMQDGEDKHGVLVETLAGLETIKAIGGDGRMRMMWESLVGKSAQSSKESKFYTSVAQTSVQFLQHMTTVVVVMIGMFLSADGTMTAGSLFAAVLLAGRAIGPMAQVSQLMVRYHSAIRSYRTLDKVMKMPVDRPEGRDLLTREHLLGEVQFQNVTFSYPEQSVPALKEVSLNIKKGDKIGIIGRIGSGKSTIAKLLLGLYEAEEGLVKLDGIDSRQLEPNDLRRNIGYVPQDPFLFRGTLRENITIAAPYATDQMVIEVAEISGVARFAHDHPLGYDMLVGEGGSGISGGQRQQIALARALLLHPPILVMDEPTSSVDSGTENEIIAKLGEFTSNSTLVLITHKPSLLKIVDRLIVVDGGKVVADGKRAVILEALASGRINATNTRMGANE